VVVHTERTSFTSHSPDTGAVPSGGIQAGAGGTATDGPSPLTLGLGSGVLALLLTAGGYTLRRSRLES
jgi:hypothetical protein